MSALRSLRNHTASRVGFEPVFVARTDPLTTRPKAAQQRTDPPVGHQPKGYWSPIYLARRSLLNKHIYVLFEDSLFPRGQIYGASDRTWTSVETSFIPISTVWTKPTEKMSTNPLRSCDRSQVLT